MRAPTQPTTRPRPSNSLLRRRQRRGTANLLVRGVGPGGGRRLVGVGSPGSTGERLPDEFLQREGNFYRPQAVVLTTQRVPDCPDCRAGRRGCLPSAPADGARRAGNGLSGAVQCENGDFGADVEPESPAEAHALV